MKGVIKKVLVVVTICILCFAGCADKAKYNYILGNGIVVDNGKRPTEGADPFSNKGIYADPEVEIDGIRESQYDYPTGSGKHLVYSSETETTYVSLYKGKRGIYYLFECEDDCLSTLNVEDINLVTAQSDSVELYVDTYGSGGKTRGSNQFEFRVTASGRIYSYLTGFVARVFTYGTLNDHTDVDRGFNVEGYISYSVLGDDVDENTPTSFAFARVTKTGNKGYAWHGNFDPQIPDNYLTLGRDNKFYTQETCPVNGTISGKLTDANNQAVVGAKVSADGYKTVYTNKDGEYSLDITNCTGDVKVNFSKKDYLDNQIIVEKKDLRLAKNNTVDLGTSLFLAANAATYTTTIKGTVTERDGVTPIKNATISVSDYSAKTADDGSYTLDAELYGYSNLLTFGAENHLDYSRNLEVSDVNIGSTTDLSTINLDENYGSSIDFGRKASDTATARIVRGEDSFKVVLKTESVIDLNQVPGSNFEVFADTKESCSMNKRDDTDYLFVFQYADEGVLQATNYGGAAVNTRSIKTTYGKINELYYVEADIPYSVINVSKDEVFGLYFGIKVNYVWTGMYDAHGDYIQAEATVNYVRLDENSQLFTGSCNTQPATDLNFNAVGRIGEFSGKTTQQYDVSYARRGGLVMLKFDLVDNGQTMTSLSHSINVYVDMNASASKTKKDAFNYHISIYPGRPISVYTGWDVAANKESSTKHYEIDSQNTWAYIYKNSIYVKLDVSIFGGDETNAIGFAAGMWHDGAGENSILSYNGKTCDFEIPGKYFIVDAAGNMSIK